MATTKNRHTAEQIVNKLRQADVELSKGATIALACKAIGVTEQTYYRWRRKRLCSLLSRAALRSARLSSTNQPALG